MDETESDRLAWPSRGSKAYREQAEGWPAVLALAAAADWKRHPVERFRAPCTTTSPRSCSNVRDPTYETRLIEMSLLPSLSSRNWR